MYNEIQWIVNSENSYFDEEEQVGILALGGGPLPLLDVMLGDINTLQIIETMYETSYSRSTAATSTNHP